MTMNERRGPGERARMRGCEMMVLAFWEERTAHRME